MHLVRVLHHIAGAYRGVFLMRPHIHLVAVMSVLSGIPSPAAHLLLPDLDHQSLYCLEKCVILFVNRFYLHLLHQLRGYPVSGPFGSQLHLHSVHYRLVPLYPFQQCVSPVAELIISAPFFIMIHGTLSFTTYYLCLRRPSQLPPSLSHLRRLGTSLICKWFFVALPSK
jgi:hypothetical protein